MVTTRSSTTNKVRKINYNEADHDEAFNARMNINSAPRRQRKRKQNEMSHTSEDDYDPTVDDYNPPNKRRKMHHHIDTPIPHPQRRSTRLAAKQSLNHMNGYLDKLDVNSNGNLLYGSISEQIENEEKDTSNTQSFILNGDLHSPIIPKRKSLRLQEKLSNINNDTTNNAFGDSDHSIQHINNNNRNGHTHTHTHLNGNKQIIDPNNVNLWTNRLRRSSRISRASIIDDEDENNNNTNNNNKKTKQDSDYGDIEFEQDLQDHNEVDDGIESEDDMNDADDMEDDSYLSSGRRRSKRLLEKKKIIHYYNDGTDIQIESKNNNDDITILNGNGQKSKSNSLPLSLRRPKRTRKPAVDLYVVEQYKAYARKQERRQSLRKKKDINYAESPGSDSDENDDDTSSDDIGTSLSTTRSPSTRRRRYGNRNRNRNRNRKRRYSNKKRRGKRSRRSISYSSSSDSSSYSTDTLMEIREQKRIRKERKKIKPIQLHDLGLYHDAMAPNLNPNKKKDKNAPADISPMEIDLNISWDMVGGLQHHVQKLKEMVILPLLYPSEFETFKMSTPKGVLFHGPPGTGKTLVARILAAQCSQGLNADGTPRKKVAFYMRKGADCLSKWVGEAERQLRLLFDEAHKNQPAVIFFDEIDGLAPVRSSRQDQIHSSIVSTLLALMDGLDSRGQIIVIGATNRPDAIDPALRRPGRFDRELCFNLPSKKARKDILKIHTKSWDKSNCKLDENMLNYLAMKSVGYCGADLEALCREAFLAAVRRTYPQIYHSNVRLQIDTKKLEVIEEDFEKALKDITPSSQRSSLVYARALPELLVPLLDGQLNNIKRDIEGVFSLKKEEYKDDEIAVIEDSNAHNTNNNNNSSSKNNNQHYRYLIHGSSSEEGQNYLGRAVLHLLEEYPMYSLDLASIYGDSTTKCADECILRIFKEASRNTPSVIYWPHIDRWWSSAHEILKTSITLLINDMNMSTPILLIATSNILMEELDYDLIKLFEKYSFHNCNQIIYETQRKVYWQQIKKYIFEKPKNKPKTISQYPNLPIAELPKEKSNAKEQSISSLSNISKTESEKLIENERMACVNLRVYIRSVCNRLCKHFKHFIDQMAEDGICNNKLSLFEIRQRNNERKIPTVIQFLKDIDQLVENVKHTAHTNSLKARQFLNEACHLQDQALSMMSQVNRDLVKQCDKLFKNSKKNNKSVTFSESVQTEIIQNNNNNNNNNDKAEKDDDDDDDIMDDNDDDDVDIIIDNNNNTSNTNNTNNNNNNNNNSDNENDENENHEIEINVNKMNGIINKLIKITKDYSIEEMEEKMYNLLRIIYSYSNQWNRNKMLDEINQHIKTYFKPKQK